MIDDGGYSVLIEVDGGIDTTNAAMLVNSGVNVLVQAIQCSSHRILKRHPKAQKLY